MQPSPRLSLPPSEVHVWSLACEALAEVPAAFHASPADRARAAALRQPADGRRHLLAQGFLRDVLARYTGLRPADLAFGRTCLHCGGPHGKPRLLAPAAPAFSLSHSGERVLVAVAARRAVGVDVEQAKPFPDVAAVAAQTFSPGERAALDAAGAERGPAFFRAWTRKEAYLKARGFGLVVPPHEVPLRELDLCGPELRLPGGTWSIHTLDAGEGYAAALAVEGEGVAVVRREWGALTCPPSSG